MVRRDVFQAIADPTRREIIALLSNQIMNLNAVADNFDMSRPAISKHIKILSECGLIEIKQLGRERFCVPQLAALDQVQTWVQQYSLFWTNKLDALEIHLEQHKKTVKKINKKPDHGK
ncbi:MAG: winged helix-turn-helix transcriptional regulator [Chitinophagales bacterium]|jgi:DNA-binding transcriptional ArsR family regulator|nr:winged helix-turn-helix transcriptional regulator [Bacteroidota bacterium]MBK7569340.1 winged helix-turn-helix transcriptional regulator [Bacteroidota bacterium]MBP8917630.1 winged helix-turn-helix transcriptional regulator [Chitinophagales bacterium]MBP9222192.1 winged helix-turn-helix transcriptional regulator [Chitinophagales bacterium]MBP9796088.1 winged helix-turn-helix transcriptional regulator [Chitinophagales bacterium]